MNTHFVLKKPLVRPRKLTLFTVKAEEYEEEDIVAAIGEHLSGDEDAMDAFDAMAELYSNDRYPTKLYLFPLFLGIAGMDLNEAYLRLADSYVNIYQFDTLYGIRHCLGCSGTDDDFARAFVRLGYYPPAELCKFSDNLAPDAKTAYAYSLEAQALQINAEIAKLRLDTNTQ